MKIYCGKGDAEKFSECLKYGDCPEEADRNEKLDQMRHSATRNEKFCLEECPYNIFNVEVEENDDNQIYVEGIDLEELKVCLYRTFYNFLGCGMVKQGEDCDNCRFYNDNIKQK